MESPQGKYMLVKQESTVRPVFGTGTPFMGKWKINTRRMKEANKVMRLSVSAYNFKTLRPAGRST
ncbi:hypothetical protein [Croceitalea dokdonensis]|nr:hypothetical protein [Croceitalea dokdonensis]